MLITQVIAELYGCSPRIESGDAVIKAAKQAAQAVGAHIIGESSVEYVPHGLTAAIFLAESHIVLTTWPEHRLLLIDLLLCNPQQSHEQAISVIKDALCPDGRQISHEVPRFIGSTPPQ